MIHYVDMFTRRMRQTARVNLATMAVACLFACPLLLEAASNTATNWLTLAELLKKWEPVPLAEIQRLAESGDACAQHYLGYCLAEGLRAQQDPAKGALWYRKALENGYLPSANNLGLLYYRGQLGTNDFTKAVEYTRFAAERGLAQSQMNMGVFYRDGEGVPADATEALRWFRLAAGQGHAGAMVEVGRNYRCGCGVKQDLSEAARWFEQAMNQKTTNDRDRALARLNLGPLYEEDFGATTKAIPFYRQAADEGQTDAMFQLYLCYWDGNGVERDHAKAMEWLKKAADERNPHAECLMGIRSEDVQWVGEGRERHLTKPDLQGALRWYRRSAAQGWAGGQYHLGMMYLEGKTVALDEARGLELVRAAADKNLRAAVRELAGVYARGVGGPRNDSERPVALFERAGAWEDLQFRYEYGFGTERDLVLAARCFCKRRLNEKYYHSPFDLADLVEFKPAAGGPMGTQLFGSPDHHLDILGPTRRRDVAASDDLLTVLSVYLKSARGDADAAYRIGELYEKGLSVPKSAPSAWAWFNIAAQNGNVTGRDKAHSLEEQMSTGELDSAKTRFSAISADLKEVAVVLR